MNRFHITRYKIYDKRVKKNFKVLVMSDLHYNFFTKSKSLDNILRKVKEVNPDYIFFPGDFLDFQDVFYNKERLLIMRLWLKQLVSVAPLFICLGNHEYYSLNCTNNNFLNDYINELNKINGVYFLNNDSFSDDNINITGLNLSREYYSITKDNIRLYCEDKRVLLSELKVLNTNIDKNKINILLEHSPIYLSDKDVLPRLKDYDYHICGHMHNGCVLPGMYELWNSDRGIVSPDKKLFPKNARSMLKEKGNKLLVSGPLVVFSKHNLFFRILNSLYPKYINVIEFTNDSKYDTKFIQYNRKYEK